MSVTFIKKFHTCATCGNKGSELLAIKSIGDIESNFLSERRPEILKSNGIYAEKITRDDFGRILFREVIEKPCDKCKTFTLEADRVDNETPVMNFYPQTEAHKWLDGLGKVGL